MTSALHKEVGNDEGLFHVVSDRAGRHIGRGGLIMYHISQVSDAAIGLEMSWLLMLCEAYQGVAKRKI